jgi:hypothetical protein
MDISLPQLQATVQKNCHISDANYAGNYTLCIYLMKMREFYRWENRFPLDTALPKEDVGNWLRAREALWDSLESDDYEPLTIKQEQFDPYDNAAINAQLNQHELVYSGGLGYQSKAHFFLARLEHKEVIEDYQILISAEEYARDLSAPPAMSNDKTIYIRRESLRRFLWEKSEEAGWHKGESALALALKEYGFSNDRLKALDTMTDAELQTVLDHEIGEVMAGKVLGPEWEELLVNIPLARTELLLRAVRDHYADAISTLPRLLQRQNKAAIHFYVANLSNLRKHLYPKLLQAYQDWKQHQNDELLYQHIEADQQHWHALATDICQQFSPHSVSEQLKAVEDLIEQRRL